MLVSACNTTLRQPKPAQPELCFTISRGAFARISSLSWQAGLLLKLHSVSAHLPTSSGVCFEARPSSSIRRTNFSRGRAKGVLEYADVSKVCTLSHSAVRTWPGTAGSEACEPARSQAARAVTQ